MPRGGWVRGASAYRATRQHRRAPPRLARLGSARPGASLGPGSSQVRPARHREANNLEAAALPFSLHSALQTSEQPVCC